MLVRKQWASNAYCVVQPSTRLQVEYRVKPDIKESIYNPIANADFVL